MTDHAVIQGSFADYRNVRSRKVVQLIIEVPAEMAPAVWERLGTPTGADEIPVAIARLVVDRVKGVGPRVGIPPSIADVSRETPIDPASSNGRTPDFDSGNEGSSPSAGTKRSWPELSPAQQAGIRCNEEAFWKFLQDDCEYYDEPIDNDEAARIVRSICNVKSRSEIILGSEAAERWHKLELDYQNWLRGTG